MAATPLQHESSVIATVIAAGTALVTAVSLAYRRVFNDQRALIKELTSRIGQLHAQMEANEAKYLKRIEDMEKRLDEREEDERELRAMADSMLRQADERERRIVALEEKIVGLETENAVLRRVVNACPVTDEACPIKGKEMKP